MTETATCPNCGLILAANAPRGLCPGCLFKRALESQGAAGGDSSPLRDAPPTPEELAPYFPDLDILRFVGRGGMGMVYQARQKPLDRMVALKILLPKIAGDRAFAERFTREARTMALLGHPHIVTVYDFGTTTMTGSDGQDSPLYYFLMEFVDGLTLRQLIDSQQLAPPQAFAIVPQICEALQYAHDKGVVHRDIKPENILMDRQGIVKIADFGLAKLMGLQGQDLTLSATGQVLGTLHYMAPEQLERPLEVDHRADIYSLGVVFYQMLTGELPLGRFAPPSQKAVVDARLDEVVLRALEKEPGRRYQNASALQTQVETIAMSPSGRALDDTVLTPPSRFRRMMTVKSRVKWIVAVAILACVAVGLFGLRNVSTGSSKVALTDSPQDLRWASKAQVIQAGIEKPISPWAWQELERRTVTPDEANTILDGLTEWLRREYPSGMPDPISWLDQFLKALDKRGLISDQRKLSFLEALEGNLRGDRSCRLREGTRELTLSVELRRVWESHLLGFQMLNQIQSISVDNQRVTVKGYHRSVWDAQHFWQPIELPSLQPGKHTIRLEVLSAFAREKDLVGLANDASSSDWPPTQKRWIRAIDVDLMVYAAGVPIVRLTDDPALEPTSHGLKVESILVRRIAGKSQGVMSFALDTQSLPVPISFDVMMRVGDQSIPCGRFYAVKSLTGSASVSSGGSGRTIYMSGETLKMELPEIAPDIKSADIVLTPNPEWIELRSDVDTIWGKEIIIRNAPIRRLDTMGSNDNEINSSPEN